MAKSSKLSKRQRENLNLTPKGELPAPEAISTIKKFRGPKFDQTINIAMHLGIDPAHADQAMRGSISLPKGIGKTKRVIAFCASDVAPRALEAGAIKAGGEDLVAEIEKGWMDFDVAVASPDMMRVISKLGKVLGPKGLMPSPKAGTVTTNVPDAVREYAAGKVEYRADKGGNIHAVIGKMSFSDQDLLENMEHFVRSIEKARPATAKGQFIRKITLSGAMTPGVQVRHTEAVVNK
jgi:large subunit ribosomal protein L1